MRGSTPGSSATGSDVCLAIVLDTGAILTGAALALSGARLLATPRVLGEVRDEKSVTVLDMLESSGKLEIVEPDAPSLEAARRAARKAGVRRRLSETDLEVLAVGIMLASQGCKVTLVTDDFSLARAAKRAGLRVSTVRYRLNV